MEQTSIYYNDPTSRATVIGATIRGTSHEGNNTPCQDAYRITGGSVAGVPWMALVVADGHGAPQHDLSHIGSGEACKEACNLLEDAALGFFKQPIKDFLEEQFPQKMFKDWVDSCKTHNALNNAENEGKQTTRDFKLKRYGTTLLAILVVKDTVFCCRVGDGDIMVHTGDDKLVKVFKDHEELVGSETYSLASADVLKHFETRFFQKSEVEAVFLSSDGLRNAYQDEKPFQDFLLAIPKQIQEYGAPPVAELIPPALKEASEFGSADDVTLLTMIFEKAVEPSGISENSQKGETQPTSEGNYDSSAGGK